MYNTGRVSTQSSTPEQFRRRRGTDYKTDAYISQPLISRDRIFGVLNISDRNDGRDFGAEDYGTIHEIAFALGEIIQRMPDEIFDPPPEPEPIPEQAQPIPVERQDENPQTPSEANTSQAPLLVDDALPETTYSNTQPNTATDVPPTPSEPQPTSSFNSQADSDASSDEVQEKSLAPNKQGPPAPLPPPPQGNSEGPSFKELFGSVEPEGVSDLLDEIADLGQVPKPPDPKS